MRLFIGIVFPEDIISNLCSLQNKMKQLTRSGKFPARENLHLTLQFLGETPESRVGDIACSLENVAKNCRPFVLSFSERLGYFGQTNPARVVWLGMKGDIPSLLSLQASIAAKTKELGFAADERAYNAHITLARDVDFINGRNLLLANGRIEFAVDSCPAIHVGQFSLLSSSIEQGKLVYRALETFTLWHATPL